MIKNWVSGDADKLVTYNVSNGLDMWRKLYHKELPDVEHQANQLSDEFMAIKPATSISDLRAKIQDIDRITSRVNDLKEDPFPEKTKVSKLRTLVPPDLFSYIALEAEKVKRINNRNKIGRAHV